MEFRTRETRSASNRRPISSSRIAHAHAIDDTKGVRIPIRSAADTNNAPAKSRGNIDGLGPPARLRRRVAATEIRSTNKANPGPPRGNIENSRCTGTEDNGFRLGGIP
jgi:hypothetical protein